MCDVCVTYVWRYVSGVWDGVGFACPPPLPHRPAQRGGCTVHGSCCAPSSRLWCSFLTHAPRQQRPARTARYRPRYQFACPGRQSRDRTHFWPHFNGACQAAVHRRPKIRSAWLLQCYGPHGVCSWWSGWLLCALCFGPAVPAHSSRRALFLPMPLRVP